MPATLAEDLKEQLRLCVARSLLPGGATPADDDGLFGLVDPKAMDAELAQLRKALNRFVPKMNAPFHRRPPPEIGSLQLLAPLWHRAAKALILVAKEIENPTINSIEASIRRGTFIPSHAVGHAARFPPLAFRTARRNLLMMAILPSLAFPLLALSLDILRTPCCGSVPSMVERLIEVWFIGPMLTAIFFASFVLPGLWAVYRTSRTVPR